MDVSATELVAGHVAGALAAAQAKGVETDTVARCLLSEAIRLFRKAGRSTDDIAAELTALADNLDEDATYGFIRP